MLIILIRLNLLLAIASIGLAIESASMNRKHRFEGKRQTEPRLLTKRISWENSSDLELQRSAQEHLRVLKRS